jgi:hypothetical protein
MDHATLPLVFEDPYRYGCAAAADSRAPVAVPRCARLALPEELLLESFRMRL